ncbi:uncharacterized protein LOC111086853 [Limulus polyphemus]|uniref:Uncharacterized protein LOC111086853 n=1 Tax=Limulus polyphemus TaxID=6850 RepID=A0ABM1SU43_LIMPO|nr:uncharacterized protein LOC111086853 [Limulus polyphemus]
MAQCLTWCLVVLLLIVQLPPALEILHTTWVCCLRPFDSESMEGDMQIATESSILLPLDSLMVPVEKVEESTQKENKQKETVTSIREGDNRNQMRSVTDDVNEKQVPMISRGKKYRLSNQTLKPSVDTLKYENEFQPNQEQPAPSVTTPSIEVLMDRKVFDITTCQATSESKVTVPSSSVVYPLDIYFKTESQIQISSGSGSFSSKSSQEQVDVGIETDSQNRLDRGNSPISLPSMIDTAVSPIVDSQNGKYEDKQRDQENTPLTDKCINKTEILVDSNSLGNSEDIEPHISTPQDDCFEKHEAKDELKILPFFQVMILNNESSETKIKLETEQSVGNEQLTHTKDNFVIENEPQEFSYTEKGVQEFETQVALEKQSLIDISDRSLSENEAKDNQSEDIEQKNKTDCTISTQTSANIADTLLATMVEAQCLEDFKHFIDIYKDEIDLLNTPTETEEFIHNHELLSEVQVPLDDNECKESTLSAYSCSMHQKEESEEEFSPVILISPEMPPQMHFVTKPVEDKTLTNTEKMYLLRMPFQTNKSADIESSSFTHKCMNGQKSRDIDDNTLQENINDNSTVANELISSENCVGAHVSEVFSLKRQAKETESNKPTPFQSLSGFEQKHILEAENSDLFNNYLSPVKSKESILTNMNMQHDKYLGKGLLLDESELLGESEAVEVIIESKPTCQVNRSHQQTEPKKEFTSSLLIDNDKKISEPKEECSDKNGPRTDTCSNLIIQQDMCLSDIVSEETTYEEENKTNVQTRPSEENVSAIDESKDVGSKVETSISVETKETSLPMYILEISRDLEIPIEDNNLTDVGLLPDILQLNDIKQKDDREMSVSDVESNLLGTSHFDKKNNECFIRPCEVFSTAESNELIGGAERVPQKLLPCEGGDVEDINSSKENDTVNGNTNSNLPETTFSENEMIPTEVHKFDNKSERKVPIVILGPNEDINITQPHERIYYVGTSVSNLNDQTSERSKMDDEAHLSFKHLNNDERELIAISQQNNMEIEKTESDAIIKLPTETGISYDNNDRSSTNDKSQERESNQDEKNVFVREKNMSTRVPEEEKIADKLEQKNGISTEVQNVMSGSNKNITSLEEFTDIYLKHSSINDSEERALLGISSLDNEQHDELKGHSELSTEKFSVINSEERLLDHVNQGNKHSEKNMLPDSHELDILSEDIFPVTALKQERKFDESEYFINIEENLEPKKSQEKKYIEKTDETIMSLDSCGPKGRTDAPPPQEQALSIFDEKVPLVILEKTDVYLEVKPKWETKACHEKTLLADHHKNSGKAICEDEIIEYQEKTGLSHLEPGLFLKGKSFKDNDKESELSEMQPRKDEKENMPDKNIIETTDSQNEKHIQKIDTKDERGTSIDYQNLIYINCPPSKMKFDKEEQKTEVCFEYQNVVDNKEEHLSKMLSQTEEDDSMDRIDIVQSQNLVEEQTISFGNLQDSEPVYETEMFEKDQSSYFIEKDMTETCKSEKTKLGLKTDKTDLINYCVEAGLSVWKPQVCHPGKENSLTVESNIDFDSLNLDNYKNRQLPEVESHKKNYVLESDQQEEYSKLADCKANVVIHKNEITKEKDDDITTDNEMIKSMICSEDLSQQNSTDDCENPRYDTNVQTDKGFISGMSTFENQSLLSCVDKIKNLILEQKELRDETEATLEPDPQEQSERTEKEVTLTILRQIIDLADQMRKVLQALGRSHLGSNVLSSVSGATLGHISFHSNIKNSLDAKSSAAAVSRSHSEDSSNNEEVILPVTSPPNSLTDNAYESLNGVKIPQTEESVTSTQESIRIEEQVVESSSSSGSGAQNH